MMWHTSFWPVLVVIPVVIALVVSAARRYAAVLRDRGVVRAERRGAYVYYCAASEALGSAVAAARALLEDQRLR